MARKNSSAEFVETFSTPDTGYNPEKWTVIDWEGGTTKQVGDESMLVSSASYSYHGIKSNQSFSPPLTLSFDIEQWNGKYGSAVYLGFIRPETYLDGEGRSASVHKQATSSVNLTFLGDTPKLKLIAQHDSPEAEEADIFKNQSGRKTNRGNLDWESGKTHSFELEWLTDKVSLSLDGEKVFQISSNIPPGPYPIYIHGQEWTGGGATELVLSKLSSTGGKSQTQTPTATPTATPTPASTSTSTATSPSTPPQTTTSDSGYNLEAGNETKVDVGYDELYVISEIPDAEPKRKAVTTQDYHLVDIYSTYDALVAKSYLEKADLSNLYQERLEQSKDRIQKWYFQQLLNRLADFILNVDAAIRLAKLSKRRANIGQVIDTVASLVDWGSDIANQPYKKRFRDIASACQNLKWINIEAQNYSIRGFSDRMKKVLTTATVGYSKYLDSNDLNSGWGEVISAASVQGPTTTLAPVLYQGTTVTSARSAKGLFVGNVAGKYVYDEVGSWLKINARIGGIMTAYHTVRKEILSDLISLESRANEGGLPPGLAAQYETDLYTLATLSTIAHGYATSGYAELNSMPTAPIWNVIMDAGDLSEVHSKIVESSAENRKITFLDIGAFHTEGKRANNSINAEVVGGHIG